MSELDTVATVEEEQEMRDGLKKLRDNQRVRLANEIKKQLGKEAANHYLKPQKYSKQSWTKLLHKHFDSPWIDALKKASPFGHYTVTLGKGTMDDSGFTLVCKDETVQKSVAECRPRNMPPGNYFIVIKNGGCPNQKLRYIRIGE